MCRMTKEVRKMMDELIFDSKNCNQIPVADTEVEEYIIERQKYRKNILKANKEEVSKNEREK